MPNQKIKILYVITQGELGGAQRYVFDLAKNLDKNRYEVMVAVGPEKPDLPQLLKKRGIKFQIIRNLRRNINPLRDVLAVWELANLIRRIQPNLVHLNSSKAGFLGSLAARLAGHQQVLFTAHGFAFLEPKPWIIKKIYFWAEKLATAFRKKTITVSDFDRFQAIASRLGPPESFITVHNGIEPQKMDNEPREKVRKKLERLLDTEVGKQDILIGTIAHDYPTKDLATLKKALAIAQAELPSLKLAIVGQGGPIGSLPEAGKLLPGFDIYASSSQKEGFPYTILEAMQAGLPIVATAVGGVPEAIRAEQEGLLVEPKNPQALANAILRLAKNPELAQTLGRNAQAKVKKFSLETMLRETETVYRGLIGEAAAAGPPLSSPPRFGD